MRCWVPALALALAPGAAAACTVPPLALALPGSVTELSAPTDGTISAAWYAGPTRRYGHGVLGDDVEAELLVARSAASEHPCGVLTAPAGDDHVFEDTAPRLADLDGDGGPEIVAVRTHVDRGAQLALYGDAGDGETLRLLATTPYIGTPHRWLAPVGAADLDGDGAVEVAYVDRPHLARTLRVWRYRDGALSEVAALEGVTNHRIGERDIAGGIRDCGAGPEMIVASADWSRLLAVTLQGGALNARDIGPHEGRASFAAALAC